MGDSPVPQTQHVLPILPPTQSPLQCTGWWRFSVYSAGQEGSDCLLTLQSPLISRLWKVEDDVMGLYSILVGRIQVIILEKAEVFSKPESF